MRLSGLFLAAVLLISSVAFAQHHDAPGAPSTPPPSPPPAAAPAPPAPSSPPSPTPPAPTLTFSTSSQPAAPVHVSEPSAPVQGNFSTPHVSPGVSPAPTPDRSPGRADFNTTRTAEPSNSSTQGIVSSDRISGENGISSAPRIGETPVDREHEPKPPEPDLKRRVCLDGNCGPKTTPPDSDLRHRVCLTGPCTCSAGQTFEKGRCIGAAVTELACPAGQISNGGSCLPVVQCRAGESWDGARCVDYSTACATISGRAATLIAEIKGLRAESEQYCMQDPSGQECADSKRRLDGALLRYRMLLTEASPTCRTQMPDPLSL